MVVVVVVVVLLVVVAVVVMLVLAVVVVVMLVLLVVVAVVVMLVLAVVVVVMLVLVLVVVVAVIPDYPGYPCATKQLHQGSQNENANVSIFSRNMEFFFFLVRLIQMFSPVSWAKAAVFRRSSGLP